MNRHYDKYPLKEKVDPNIYEAVKCLNGLGLTVQFSCAGYGPVANPVTKYHKRKTHFSKELFTPSPQLLFEPEVTGHPLMIHLVDMINYSNQDVQIEDLNSVNVTASEYMEKHRKDYESGRINYFCGLPLEGENKDNIYPLFEISEFSHVSLKDKNHPVTETRIDISMSHFIPLFYLSILPEYDAGNRRRYRYRMNKLYKLWHQKMNNALQELVAVKFGLESIYDMENVED